MQSLGPTNHISGAQQSVTGSQWLPQWTVQMESISTLQEALLTVSALSGHWAGTVLPLPTCWPVNTGRSEVTAGTAGQEPLSGLQLCCSAPALGGDITCRVHPPWAEALYHTEPLFPGPEARQRRRNKLSAHTGRQACVPCFHSGSLI